MGTITRGFANNITTGGILLPGAVNNSSFDSMLPCQLLGSKIATTQATSAAAATAVGIYMLCGTAKTNVALITQIIAPIIFIIFFCRGSFANICICVLTIA